MNSALPTIGHLVHRLDRAGADRLAAESAIALADRYRFVFLSLGPTGELGRTLHGQDHKVVQLRHTPFSPLTPLRIRRAVRRYGIQLLHTHAFATHRLACLSRGTGTHPPLIMTDHAREVNDRANPARSLCHRLTHKSTDRIVAAAEHIRDALRDHDGLARADIRVIPIGIDPSRFTRQTPETRTRARQKLGVPADAPTIMQVARFAPEKDHATALRAFARTHDQLPDARLVLLGDGPTLGACEQLAWDLGVSDHVLFLGQRDDVDTLLPGADVFCLPSLTEGTSPTTLEAMATGLPVAATSVGGLPEIVAHGQTGLLSPPRDAHALSHNLLVLLRDPGLRQRMGDAGHARVREHFTRAKMLDAYADLYQQSLRTT